MNRQENPSITKTRRLLLLTLLIILVGVSSAPAFADNSEPSVATQAATQPLIVGIKLAPPFVISNPDGYDGLGIDLWKQAAEDHGWKYEFHEYEFDALLEAVRAGKIDVALGAITATAEREAVMDFSHSILSSGLGVAVRNEQQSGWLAVVRALVSPAFLKVLSVLVLLLLIVGTLVWLLERKNNPEQFGGDRKHGIFSGFWWAMVTMTTVGYGDLAPRSVGGRLLGLVWMLAALIVVSFFTASITSALTVGQLSQRIGNVDDLANMRVASVPDTTSAAWLESRKLYYSDAKDLDTALADLAEGRCDAVVYDSPLLRWKIRQKYRGKLQMLPLVLERQDYAFALPEGSALREPLNASLLTAINAADWHKRVARFLGNSD